MCLLIFFFFFKQKTAYEMRISDWSSDVCSSDLWHQDRSGLLTASRFKDVIAWGDRDKHGKRKPLAARTTYMRELAFERLANRSKHSVSSKRSEEHTSELQSLMRNSYAVFCLKKKTDTDADAKTADRHNQQDEEADEVKNSQSDQ